MNPAVAAAMNTVLKRFLTGGLLVVTGCFTPIDENLEPVKVLSAGEDAGVDAGVRVPDAGAAPYFGTVTGECGPADGPASRFVLSRSARACGATGVSELSVTLWQNPVQLGTWRIEGTSLGADGVAVTCSALECFYASSGSSFTIDHVDATSVEGSMDLHFISGDVQGRFRVEVCPAGPLYCG